MVLLISFSGLWQVLAQNLNRSGPSVIDFLRGPRRASRVYQLYGSIREIARLLRERRRAHCALILLAETYDFLHQLSDWTSLNSRRVAASHRSAYRTFLWDFGHVLKEAFLHKRAHEAAAEEVEIARPDVRS